MKTLTAKAKQFLVEYNELAKKHDEHSITYKQLAAYMGYVDAYWYHKALLKANLLKKDIVQCRLHKKHIRRWFKKPAMEPKIVGKLLSNKPRKVEVPKKTVKGSEFARVEKYSLKQELQTIALKIICGKLTPAQLMEIGQDIYEITTELK